MRHHKEILGINIKDNQTFNQKGRIIPLESIEKQHNAKSKNIILTIENNEVLITIELEENL